MQFNNKITGKPITFGLALAAGGGVILMLLALAFGVVESEGANNQVITISFVAGLLLFIVGVAGWAVVTEPWKHFDDISQPKDSGHGHGSPVTALATTDHADSEQPSEVNVHEPATNAASKPSGLPASTSAAH